MTRKTATRSTFGRVLRRKGRDGEYLPGFYVRLRRGGRETTRWAGPDRKTANELLANLLRKSAREDLLGEKTIAAVSFADLKTALVAHFTAEHGATTFAREEGRLDRIADHFGTRSVRDLGTGDVQDFLSSLENRRGNVEEGKDRPAVSAATRNRYAAALSTCFRYAVDRGFARTNPVRGLPRPREAIPAIAFVPASDVDRVIAAATEPEFRALLRIVAETGLRKGEARVLEWRDVDFVRRVVVVRRSKSGRSREVPMTVAVRATLLDMQRCRAPVPISGPHYLWPQYVALHDSALTARFARAARRAGLERLRLHDLRHGFCSRLAQAGVPIPTIQALAGHLDSRMTMRYASHLPDGAMAAAMKTLDAARRRKPKAKGDAAGDAERGAVASRAAVGR